MVDPAELQSNRACRLSIGLMADRILRDTSATQHAKSTEYHPLKHQRSTSALTNDQKTATNKRIKHIKNTLARKSTSSYPEGS